MGRDARGQSCYALLEVAARCGDEERAAFYVASHRSDQPDDEANRIAADHGFSPDRLIAMKALARSRGVDLGTVLRAASQGDLRGIMELPLLSLGRSTMSSGDGWVDCGAGEWHSSLTTPPTGR